LALWGKAKRDRGHGVSWWERGKLTGWVIGNERQGPAPFVEALSIGRHPATPEHGKEQHGGLNPVCPIGYRYDHQFDHARSRRSRRAGRHARAVREQGGLTTSTSPDHIQENFEIDALPEDAMREIRDNIATNIRFNNVTTTGVPGFILRGK
jgi:hypothetical protein